MKGNIADWITYTLECLEETTMREIASHFHFG